jgi:hypothetical protein
MFNSKLRKRPDGYSQNVLRPFLWWLKIAIKKLNTEGHTLTAKTGQTIISIFIRHPFLKNGHKNFCEYRPVRKLKQMA